jgi:hypothetical protein
MAELSELPDSLGMCARALELQSWTLPHKALLRLVNITFDHLCGIVVTFLERCEWRLEVVSKNLTVMSML